MGSLFKYPVPDLLVGVVTADGLAAIEVGVDARIYLVHHVALVGASSVGCWAWSAGAHAGAAVAVRVDMGVGGIGETAAVRTMRTGRLTMCAGHAGDAGASVVAGVEGTAAGVGGKVLPPVLGLKVLPVLGLL